VDSADAHSPGRGDDFRHVLDAPWFYRFGFFLGRNVPKSALYRLADLVGDLSRAGYPERDRAVRENLRRVFPGASDSELASLSRRVFRNFTRYLVDFGRYRSMTREAILEEIGEFEGIGHMHAAAAAGRGLLVTSAHIGNWELGGFFFGSADVPINVVTVPEGRPAIDALRDRYRRGRAVRTLVVDGSPFSALEMMAALKRNEVVAMLVDRWGPEGGIRTPFFDGACWIPRGPLVLSRSTGAPVLPSFVVRDGGTYRAVIEEPFTVGEGDEERCARRLAAALERVILRFPDQWYNFVPLAPAPPDLSAGAEGARARIRRVGEE
jgi:KDO2-lipid IV(A) lauroyltransferase